MTLLCSELNPEENTKVMPNDYVLTFSLQVKIGPRPNYPRHNAAAQSDEV